MKIGIDIGGSHIACGLVDNGNIIMKKEKDFLEKDKVNIKKIIEATIIEYIEEILKEKNLNINNLELIGIAAPRNNKR